MSDWGPLLLLAADEAGDTVNLSSQATRILGGLILAYIVGLFLLSLYAKGKVKNETDYLVAGRRLPLFLAWGTLIATWFGAASILGSAEAAREGGVIDTVLDPWACAFTLVIAGLFFAGPLWRMKLLTMGDFYRRIYGPRAEILGCSIQVPSYFGWIAAQYTALAAIQHAYFDVPIEYGILIGAGVTLVYTMIGGMWSVTLTDTAQIVIAMLGLLFLAEATYSLLGDGSVFDGLNRTLAHASAEGTLTLLPPAEMAVILGWLGAWATGLFGNLPGQDLQQRVFAAKSARVASQACILGGIAYLAFGLIPVSLGLASRLTNPDGYEGKILVLLAGKYLTPVMAIVFVMSLVSIIISTATSAVLAPAAMLGHNLLGRIESLKPRKLLVDRASVALITLGGVGLAFTGESIMGLLDASLSVALVALFVPLVMGLYGKPRSELSAVLAMSFGFVVWLPPTVASFALPHVESESLKPILEFMDSYIPADLLGLGASFLGYFLGQFASRNLPVLVDSEAGKADDAEA